MKTKELIKQLQEQDPSGELEVIAGGSPIYFIDCEPAYYDGALEILIQDASLSGYNIVGFKYTNKGNKIRLHLMDLDDVLLDDPELPVDVSEVADRYKDYVEKTREEMRQIKNKVAEHVKTVK